MNSFNCSEFFHFSVCTHVCVHVSMRACVCVCERERECVGLSKLELSFQHNIIVLVYYTAFSSRKFCKMLTRSLTN